MDHCKSSKRTDWLIAAGILCAISIVKFYPVLFDDYSILHGDALDHHSLAVQTLLSETLKNGQIPLWSRYLYGGHPVFAEGQGGFAYPINLILFSFFETLWAHNFLLFLLSLLTGVGMFGLCRKWNLSLPASVFGALALTYSESWIGMTYNACFYQTMAWIPFTLMAMECWWEKPSLGNVVFFAVSFSQVILGGINLLYMACCFSLS